ncbi:MAG: hypothetical protein J4428_01195 [Candidatus Aenigmarchaeota archaeon]|nr:hypothetical protein [Candidatus Aenigmarchaeota archaeon]
MSSKPHVRTLKAKLHDNVVSAILADPKVVPYKIIRTGEIVSTYSPYSYPLPSGRRGSIDILYVILFRSVYHLVGLEYESTSYGEGHAESQLRNARKQVELQFAKLLPDGAGATSQWHGVFVYYPGDVEEVLYIKEVLESLRAEEISFTYLTK